LLFHIPPFAHIDERAYNEVFATLRDGTEADFHRDFLTIATASQQRSTPAHGSRDRMTGVATPHIAMHMLEVPRKQAFDALADELSSLVPEQSLKASVHDNDQPLGIDDDNAHRKVVIRFLERR
jgi:hypothetical protein